MIYLKCIRLIGIGRIWKNFYKSLKWKSFTCLVWNCVAQVISGWHCHLSQLYSDEPFNFYWTWQFYWASYNQTKNLYEDEYFHKCVLQLYFIREKFWKIYITIISIDERLAMTVRYLGTRDLYHTISYGFHVDHSTVQEIVVETSDAIFKSLEPEYMKVRNQIIIWISSNPILLLFELLSCGYNLLWTKLSHFKQYFQLELPSHNYVLIIKGIAMNKKNQCYVRHYFHEQYRKNGLRLNLFF